MEGRRIYNKTGLKIGIFSVFIVVILIIVYSCTMNKSDNWMKDAVIYEVNIRQYTKEGTFNAFSEHLPRLKEMGVNVLWFMPIHPISSTKRIGPLGSYYSIRDYKAVNHEFGTEEDFKKLVDKAHDMGFKVIMDWVANHTGWDHPWIKEHPDWYVRDAKGNIVHPETWEDVAQLDYSNKKLRKEMIKTMKYWVTKFDIDGFRCDYAGGVPVDFWEEAARKINPTKKLFMLAEDNVKYELLDKAFQANYGWDLYHLMNDIAKGKKNAQSIISYQKRVDTLYPKGTYPMLFTSNHDENSWNGTEFERMGEAYEAMSVLTFTLPGVPMIYSGQEAGLNKRLEFFSKDEIDWSNLLYENHYKQLISLKKQNKALYTGKYGGDIAFFDTSKNVLAFKRQKNDNIVIVVMNLSSSPINETINFGDNASNYISYFTDELVELQANHSFTLDKWEYKVFIKLKK
ncbi:MAG: alpha-amylase [Bacilli bacterium]|nr:alpha-amylase [Bacilli bacterium]